MHKGCSYLVMDRMEGECLAQGWTRRTPESKAEILRQLREMVDSMRRIDPPGSAVANTAGGLLWDCRLPGKSLDFGPFESIDAFHRHICRNFVDRDSEKLPLEVQELFKLQSRDWGSPVFTHGDLSSLNILAKGDKITGIVDWETAGWFPYYWEYTTACQVNIRNLFWREEIEKFLTPFPVELEMEALRQRYFGDV